MEASTTAVVPFSCQKRRHRRLQAPQSLQLSSPVLVRAHLALPCGPAHTLISSLVITQPRNHFTACAGILPAKHSCLGRKCLSGTPATPSAHLSGVQPPLRLQEMSALLTVYALPSKCTASWRSVAGDPKASLRLEQS